MRTRFIIQNLNMTGGENRSAIDLTMKRIPDKLYAKIKKLIPIFCVDLIVKNKKGKILLGKRTNAPLKEKWFLPGGRVLRNEIVYNAARRILKKELGSEGNPKLVGFYEVFYPEVHNIIALFEVVISGKVKKDSQHSELKWVRTLPRDIIINIFGKETFYRGFTL